MARFAAAMLTSPVFIPRVYSKELVDCTDCKMKRLPKAHELSLYDKDDADCCHSSKDKVEEQGKLEEGIGIVRKKVTGFVLTFGGIWDTMQKTYNTGYAHTKNTYDYVTEDANIIPRVLTIFSGGIIGLVFASRRGTLKKIAYTSAGMGITTAAVYPSQTKEYTKAGFCLASEKANNFMKDKVGVDVGKVASEKIELVKSTANVENVTKVTANWIHKLNPFSKKEKEGDIGQSNPKDDDLYTTRKEK